MKPILSGTQDSDSLQDLGRASVQIVHDLKNQLNGLKLYATFLRKRLEKSGRPADEQETVVKLISGLERAAHDLSTIVQYGQPIDLRKQPGVDIQRLIAKVCATLKESYHDTGDLTGSIILESDPTKLCGEFDPGQLSEAIRAISWGALKMVRNQTGPQNITLRVRKSEPDSEAIVEWVGINEVRGDPFRSFAGSDQIRMSLAAKIIEAHGGSALYTDGLLRIRLPLEVK